MPTDRNDPGCSEQTCHYAVFHGPGHQSRTTCQKLGPHFIHEARYGAEQQLAVWVGDRDAMTGFFDEPPESERAGKMSDYQTERAENKLVEITIRTHVPSKWRFVDLETGDIWRQIDGRFRRADDIQVTPAGAPEAR